MSVAACTAPLQKTYMKIDGTLYEWELPEGRNRVLFISFFLQYMYGIQFILTTQMFHEEKKLNDL